MRNSLSVKYMGFIIMSYLSAGFLPLSQAMVICEDDLNSFIFQLNSSESSAQSLEMIEKSGYKHPRSEAFTFLNQPSTRESLQGKRVIIASEDHTHFKGGYIVDLALENNEKDISFFVLSAQGNEYHIQKISIPNVISEFEDRIWLDNVEHETVKMMRGQISDLSSFKNNQNGFDYFQYSKTNLKGLVGRVVDIRGLGYFGSENYKSVGLVTHVVSTPDSGAFDGGFDLRITDLKGKSKIIHLAEIYFSGPVAPKITYFGDKLVKPIEQQNQFDGNVF